MTFDYKIGPLFPLKPGTNEPNIIFSSDLTYNKKDKSIESKDKKDVDGKGEINTALTITTKPFEVRGLENFVRDYYEANVNVNNYLIDEATYTDGNFGYLQAIDNDAKKFKDSSWYQYYQKSYQLLFVQIAAI